MNNKKNGTSNLIALMSIFLLGSGLLGINPVLQKLIEAFPKVPRTTIMMASTLPAIISVIISLLAGTIVGRKIKYKTIQIIGIFAFIIGGMAPIFINSSFTYILAARIIFGIGIGCFGMRNALLMRFYEGEKRSRYLGIGQMIANIGVILLQTVSGILADIHWNYAFYSYLLGAFSLICIILFLKEPEQVVLAEGTEKIKVTVQPAVWFYTFFIFACTTLLYPLLTNMSSFIVMKNFGQAAVAGTVLSLYTIGGAITAAFFGKIYSLCKKYILAVICLTITVGQALVLYANNLPMVYIGATLCGFGFFCLIPIFMTFVGIVSDKQSLPIATALIQFGLQIGVFVSSYWAAFSKIFTGNVITGAYLAAWVGFGIIGLLNIFFDPRPKQKILEN